MNTSLSTREQIREQRRGSQRQPCLNFFFLRRRFDIYTVVPLMDFQWLLQANSLIIVDKKFGKAQFRAILLRPLCWENLVFFPEKPCNFLNKMRHLLRRTHSSLRIACVLLSTRKGMKITLNSPYHWNHYSLFKSQKKSAKSRANRAKNASARNIFVNERICK